MWERLSRFGAHVNVTRVSPAVTATVGTGARVPVTEQAGQMDVWDTDVWDTDVWESLLLHIFTLSQSPFLGFYLGKTPTYFPDGSAVAKGIPDPAWTSSKSSSRDNTPAPGSLPEAAASRHLRAPPARTGRSHPTNPAARDRAELIRRGLAASQTHPRAGGPHSFPCSQKKTPLGYKRQVGTFPWNGGVQLRPPQRTAVLVALG